MHPKYGATTALKMSRAYRCGEPLRKARIEQAEMGDRSCSAQASSRSGESLGERCRRARYSGARNSSARNSRRFRQEIDGDYQPIVPGSPLNGPTISEVIQPP